ncbi:MAG: L-histidine N(alpha)-methyltransferase [Gemmataceae bacterium]
MISTVDDPTASSFRADVLRGLLAPRKTLPCKYLYDEAGSALFERITALDEYYPTRVESGIMARHAPEMAGRLGRGCLLVEYGSGSSTKTRALLDRLEEPAGYVPVDVSPTALRAAARALTRDYPGLSVRPLLADFTRLTDVPAAGEACRAVYFPGSTVGNFHPDEAADLLRRAAGVCGPGGSMLLGADLRKDRRVLESAYDDREGVTAAFNRNLLVRINRELGADLEVGSFAHRAVYDEARGRVEMHLVSRREQRARVAGVEVRFEAGESIHTENSYKYSLTGLRELASAGGFVLERSWADDGRQFCVLHLRAAG